MIKLELTEGSVRQRMSDYIKEPKDERYSGSKNRKINVMFKCSHLKYISSIMDHSDPYSDPPKIFEMIYRYIGKNEVGVLITLYKGIIKIILKISNLEQK